jgi:hypothetical protein
LKSKRKLRYCRNGDEIINRNLIYRVRKIERRTFKPRWRVVTKDYDGLYRGECGDGLSQEQFDVWFKQQDKDTQIIIVEVCENKPPPDGVEGKPVTVEVKNYAAMNVEDLLREIDRLEEEQINLPAVDVGGFSEQEKNTVLEAYRVIREHHPVQAMESMH